MGHPIAGIFLAGIGVGMLLSAWAVQGKEERSALLFGGIVMDVLAILMAMGTP